MKQPAFALLIILCAFGTLTEHSSMSLALIPSEEMPGVVALNMRTSTGRFT